MNIVEKLAETFRAVAVSRAYGEPVKVGGETIVPVALVQAGFGGDRKSTRLNSSHWE